MTGFLLVDKPVGITSFDLIRIARRLSWEKKIGHAGTLDKLASGLMILAFGEATKLLEYLIGLDKEYEVKVRFGETSETYDAEGPIKSTFDFDSEKVLEEFGLKDLKKKIVNEIAKDFSGRIQQIPPRYSALKIGGRRASDRVRKGEVVEMKARGIEIYGFEMIESDWPEVTFRIHCGSGTYIRSLVHDLGQNLGWGAYVMDLRRIKISNLSVRMAVSGFDGTDLSKNFEQQVLSIEDFIATKIFNGSRFLELSEVDFLRLKTGGVLMGKKVEQGGLFLAFYKHKIVGVLGNYKNGVKFKKQIN